MLELVRGRRRRAPNPLTFLLAAAGGAVASSTLTMLATNQRRAHARDRMTAAAAHTVDLMGKAARDAKNRATGAAAVAKGAMRTDDASDEKLVARVRSKLGRVVSHPHAIAVEAKEGRVVLAGPILASEFDHLMHEVRRVRGVYHVDNKLEVHAHGKDIPGLQGPGRPTGASPLQQEHWTPSLRLGAGLLGAAFAAAGLARPARPTGMALTGLGTLLLMRAGFDKPLTRILGIGSTRRSVEFHKTMTISAPVPEVFAQLTDIGHFPDLMDHVKGVRPMGERRSHWQVRGPLGSTVEWDAETTSFIENRQIGWRSLDGSLIKHAGLIRLAPVDEGRGTRLDVQLGYNPVAGYVGHGVARLFGVDPKKSLDDDLLRLKSLLEEGAATAHGRRVTRATMTH